MELRSYGFFKKVNGTFQEGIERTREALKKNGFGILWEIDVKATMKAKLGVDYDNYMILGACNPPIAHRAFQADYDIGLLLPCNFIVYEKGGSVFLGAINPKSLFGIVDKKDMVPIAEEVSGLLKNIIDSV